MKHDISINLDFHDTAGYKLAKQIERNEEFFRKQREKQRKRENKQNAKEHTDSQ